MDNEFTLTTETENENIISETDDTKNEPEPSQKNKTEVSSESDGQQQTEPLEDSGEDNINSKLEKMIDELPDNFPKALPIIRSDIAPVIATFDESLVEYYVEKLKKKTGTLKKPIMDEIKQAKENIRAKEFETEIAGVEELEMDPEIQQLADEISRDPLLFKNKITIINQLGVINERKPIGLYLVTIDSRCLPMGTTGSEALATKNSGPYGAGKSHPMFACIKIYPKTAYHLITSGSAKSLYNIKGGLKHKALILTEALQLQGESSADSELVYSIRSLISEGTLIYQYTGYNEDGEKVTIIKRMDGPTSLLTTTVQGRLEAQLEDRLITVHPNVSSKQTQDILTKTANIASGNVDIVDDKTIKAWKLYHSSLEPLEVIIPFAKDIADYVNYGGELPISARRAFKRVLSTIKTITTVHQKQRSTDDMGRVIAEIQDYSMALQLIEESFVKRVEDSYEDKRIRLIEKYGPITPRKLAKQEGVSGSAISQWCEKWLDQDVLCWSDKDGQPIDGDKLNRFKRTGKAHLKIFKINRLPTPFELTGDPRYSEDGDLYKFYDLELEPSDLKEHLLSDNTEATTPLNTSKDSYDIDNKQKRDSLTGGVKLISEISNKNEIKIISKLPKEQKKYSDLDPETKNFADEIGECLLVPDERVPTNNKPVRKTGSLPENILLV